MIAVTYLFVYYLKQIKVNHNEFSLGFFFSLFNRFIYTSSNICDHRHLQASFSSLLPLQLTNNSDYSVRVHTNPHRCLRNNTSTRGASGQHPCTYSHILAYICTTTASAKHLQSHYSPLYSLVLTTSLPAESNQRL